MRALIAAKDAKNAQSVMLYSMKTLYLKSLSDGANPMKFCRTVYAVKDWYNDRKRSQNIAFYFP